MGKVNDIANFQIKDFIVKILFIKSFLYLDAFFCNGGSQARRL